MPSNDARTAIDRQLELAVAEIEAFFAAGNSQIFSAQSAAGVAALVYRADLNVRVRALLADLTLKDQLRGAITNIDLHTVDLGQPISAPAAEAFARDHPACDDHSLLTAIKSYNDPHIRLCLSGDTEAAERAAESELALEDIASTLAVLGQFDRAAAFINSRCKDAHRKAGVRFIILLETCRRKLPGFAEAIDHARLGVDGRLHVVLALANRMPWRGYPYSDW